MTRTTRLLGLVMVLALLMALVSTATAAAPADSGDWCDNHPDNPKCQPISAETGFTCADYNKLNPGRVLVESWRPEHGGVITIDLAAKGPAFCIDLLNGEAGSLKVTVGEMPAGATTLYALIKDSHPGDHCAPALNIDLKKSDIRTGELDVPLATVNACEGSWPEVDLVHGQFVQKVDGVTDPLALMVGFTGKRGITANVTITYKAQPAQ